MISIAIPAYNGSPFLKLAVDSIVNQTYKVEQVIIVDDVSSDNTPEVVKELQKEYTQIEIKYYRNETNLGWQGNKNRCFDLCTTKYLIILHQDDKMLPEMVEKLISLHEEKPELACAGGNAIIINQYDRIISEKKKTKPRIFQKDEIYEFVTSTGSYIPFSTVMFDIAKIRKIGYFRTDVAAADEFYWPLVLTKHPIGVLGENLVYRKVHPDQAELVEFHTKSDQTLKALLQFDQIEKYEKREDKKKLLEVWYKNKVVNTLVYVSISIIKTGGSSDKAFYFVKHALSFDFSLALTKRNFWKSCLLILLNSLGLYKYLKKKKKR